MRKRAAQTRRFPVSAEPPKVLLVDDEPVVTSMLCTYLTCRQISIIGEAGDGRQAVQMAADLRPQVVILDIALPGLDGFGAAREILRNCPEVAILMLSARSSPDCVVRALQAGALGFIPKPMDLSEVAEGVRAVAQGSMFLSKSCKTNPMVETAAVLSLSAAEILQGMTERQRAVFYGIVQGKTTKEIATDLKLSVKTIDKHRTALMRRLNVTSVKEVILCAARHNLVA